MHSNYSGIFTSTHDAAKSPVEGVEVGSPESTFWIIIILAFNAVGGGTYTVGVSVISGRAVALELDDDDACGGPPGGGAGKPLGNHVVALGVGSAVAVADSTTANECVVVKLASVPSDTDAWVEPPHSCAGASVVSVPTAVAIGVSPA